MGPEEAKIQSWLDAMEEYLVVVSGSGRILRVNKHWRDFCRDHQVNPNLYQLGGDFFEEFQLKGRKREMETVRQAATGEIEEDSQMYPFSLPDGDIQWFSAKVKNIQLAGEGTAAILFLRPVTLDTVEPFTAESVLESMGDGFYHLDDAMRFVYVNLNGEKLLQRKRQELVGRNVWKAFPELFNSAFHEEFDRAVNEQVERYFESFYEPLGKWFEVKVHPLKKGGLAVYFRDITTSKLNELKLTEFAYFDPLTGLPNRRRMKEIGQELIGQNKKFTVFYLNLDNLKIINSLHHYRIGDEVLKQVSWKLRKFEDSSCTVGRLFGDEFMVILEPQPKERLEDFAEKLQSIFMESFEIDVYHSVHISASIGIACYPFDSANLDELLAYAENAMGEAKKTPGTSYAFFRPEMRAAQSRRSKIETGLKNISEANGFFYHLQPQVDGVTGSVTGVEVLARWNHPELGPLSPLEFISVAEQTATIAPFTLHLLEKVFAQIKEWREVYEWDLTVAINIAPALLDSSIFFEDFFQLLEYFELPAELIEVEITEQVELAYSEKVIENLRYCRSRGICIAIDDFGTGFSMLSYLTNFPIDKIKIDKFFVRQIGQDKKAEAVLTSIIKLVRSVECDVLAEGVEREAEAKFLLEHDCSKFQGYLYDKPMPAADFERRYLNNRHSQYTPKIEK